MPYVYCADIYCGVCGKEIIEDCKDVHEIDRDCTDSFPQFDDSSGEADCPQHCGECGVFLENPLTTDGYEYVKEAVLNDLKASNLESIAVTEWGPFYDIESLFFEEEGEEE